MNSRYYGLKKRSTFVNGREYGAYSVEVPPGSGVMQDFHIESYEILHPYDDVWVSKKSGKCFLSKEALDYHHLVKFEL